jgi:hypothetical protein
VSKIAELFEFDRIIELFIDDDEENEDEKL